jgi:hypothetical protein
VRGAFRKPGADRFPPRSRLSIRSPPRPICKIFLQIRTSAFAAVCQWGDLMLVAVLMVVRGSDSVAVIAVASSRSIEATCVGGLADPSVRGCFAADQVRFSSLSATRLPRSLSTGCRSI